MTVAIVTHESVTKHRGWTVDQVHRVLDKLDDTNAAMLRLDPGFALDVAEAVALRQAGLTVVPAQPNWVPMWQAYQRHAAERRLQYLLADPTVAQPKFLAADEEGRVSFRGRDEHLALTCDTHVVVYDGRDRGSVVRYLQLVHGVQDTIIINPLAREVGIKKGTPCPQPSTALVPVSVS